MKTVNIFSGLLTVLLVVTMSGCSMFGSNDDKVPSDTVVPPSSTAPETLTVDGGTDSGWTAGNSETPAQPGDFVPIPNQHFPCIYFAYDRDVIGTSEQIKLDSIAKLMKAQPDICLIIQGNCDDRGTEEYNRALGERRAIAVKNYFVNQGISADRFKTISFGKDNPVVKGTDPASRAKNRRADLVPAKRR